MDEELRKHAIAGKLRLWRSDTVVMEDPAPRFFANWGASATSTGTSRRISHEDYRVLLDLGAIEIEGTE